MSAPEEEPNRSSSAAAFAAALGSSAVAAMTRSWTASMWNPPAAASRTADPRSLVPTDRATATSAGSTVGPPMARTAKRIPDSASSPAGVSPGPRPPSASASGRAAPPAGPDRRRRPAGGARPHPPGPTAPGRSPAVPVMELRRPAGRLSGTQLSVEGQQGGAEALDRCHGHAGADLAAAVGDVEDPGVDPGRDARL